MSAFLKNGGSLPHQPHVNGCEVRGRLATVPVDVSYVLGQTQVAVGVWLVLDQPEQVEPGQQSRRQLDVLLDALAGIIAAVGRVGRCQDGAPGVQGGHDAGLERSEAQRMRVRPAQ